MHSKSTLAVAAVATLVALAACREEKRPTAPVAITVAADSQPVTLVPTDVPNAVLPPGYFLAPVATGLDFPTAVAFSGGQIWVAEAGATPGSTPKVKRIIASGEAITVLDGASMGDRFLGPLTDVTFHDGWLWVTHRQTGVNGWPVGAISKFKPDDPMGTFTTVLTGLPSAGDHYTEEVVFDDNGRGYFSQGTATNSSVVGADNWLITAWLQQAPTFHDFPAKQVVLNGKSYKTAVPFPLDPSASRITAPFMPFGSGAVAPGTVVPGVPRDGIVAGNGAIYSFDANAADATASLRLEAWGFRNPYGIGLDPFNPGVLYATNNGADTRGVAGETTVPIDEDDLTIVESRPVDEDFDDLYKLQVGGTEEFFGFPDFFHNEDTGAPEPVTDEDFCEELDPCPEFVLDAGFRSSLHVEPAVAELGYHTSANKFDIAADPQFGHQGNLFVAETGSFVPVTGATEFTGYSVQRVDASGKVTDFLTHPALTQGVLFDPTGVNKPIDVKFDGEVMLVVDFGVFEPGLGLMLPGSGKLWAVCHGAEALRQFVIR